MCVYMYIICVYSYVYMCIFFLGGGRVKNKFFFVCNIFYYKDFGWFDGL